MSYFNVRVYGLLINNNNEILLSDEQLNGFQFTKFPGGGVELGEGLIAALKREFLEECNLKIEVIDHFYTTDFYEKSVFNDSQVISIYYLVKPLEKLNIAIKTSIFDFSDGVEQTFRWVNLNVLNTKDVTFKTEKKVISILLKNKK
jgi:ADP-ribose pyrophosphatase YjhB (NUDIX family)